MKKLSLINLKILILLFTLSACAHIDPKTVKPSTDIPEVANIEQIQIPYNNSLPTYLLTVEPVVFTKRGPVYFKKELSSDHQDSANSKSGGSRTDWGNSQDSNLKAQGQIIKGEKSQGANTPPQEQNKAANQLSPGVKNVALIETNDDDENKEQNKDPKISGAYARAEVNSGTASKGSVITKQGSNSKAHYQQEGSVYTESGSYSFEESSRQRQISAQLISALSGVKNFQLLDNSRFNQQYKCGNCLKLQNNQKGPLIIRAEVTEYNSYAEEKKNKLNLFTLYASKSKLITGVVALDVSILDSKSGSIVASFPVRGTFSNAQEKTSGGLIWTIAEQEHYLQSVIDQALRVALNSAAEKLLEALKTI